MGTTAVMRGAQRMRCTGHVHVAENRRTELRHDEITPLGTTIPMMDRTSRR